MVHGTGAPLKAVINYLVQREKPRRLVPFRRVINAIRQMMAAV
jgi:hypothetical protein